MNDVEQLHRIVQEAIPRAVMKYEPPLLPTGIHHLNVWVDGHWYTVIWRTEGGFWIGYNDPNDDVGLFDQILPGDVNVQTVEEAEKVLLGLIAEPRPAAAAAAR